MPNLKLLILLNTETALNLNQYTSINKCNCSNYIDRQSIKQIFIFPCTCCEHQLLDKYCFQSRCAKKDSLFTVLKQKKIWQFIFSGNNKAGIFNNGFYFQEVCLCMKNAVLQHPKFAQANSEETLPWCLARDSTLLLDILG